MSEQHPTATAPLPPTPPPSYPPHQPDPQAAPRLRDRRLALPWAATVAVVALLVGGGLGAVIGYAAHGDSSSSFDGPGGFQRGGFPGNGQMPQMPGNGQAPGGQLPQQPGS